jgi:hypothetical protein
VSRSVYANDPAAIQPGVTVLPPGWTSGCVVATDNAAYPQVWNNALADGSFGVTSRIFLDQITPDGALVSTLPVPDGAGRGPSERSGRDGDGVVTSFSSKSELALNLSTSGREVTFMGYAAPPAALDVSNSNTPGVIDPTNPVPGAYYRGVAELDQQGRFRFTETNAFSGNNGRAAILSDRAPTPTGSSPHRQPGRRGAGRRRDVHRHPLGRLRQGTARCELHPGTGAGWRRGR